MILRELYYFDVKTMEPVEDENFDLQDDSNAYEKSDTRKTKLTLKDINKARKASDMHRKLKQEELNLVRQMYGAAAQAAAGGM